MLKEEWMKTKSRVKTAKRDVAKHFDSYKWKHMRMEKKLFRGRTFKIVRCLKRRIDEYEKCENRTAGQ